MHDKLLAKFLVMFDQIRIEEILVGIVSASQIVSFLIVTNLAHRKSPAFGVDAGAIDQVC
jgi:hypothetical protein